LKEAHKDFFRVYSLILAHDKRKVFKKYIRPISTPIDCLLLIIGKFFLKKLSLVFTLSYFMIYQIPHIMACFLWFILLGFMKCIVLLKLVVEIIQCCSSNFISFVLGSYYLFFSISAIPSFRVVIIILLFSFIHITLFKGLFVLLFKKNDYRNCFGGNCETLLLLVIQIARKTCKSYSEQAPGFISYHFQFFFR